MNMELIFLIIGMAVGFFTGWFISKYKYGGKENNNFLSDSLNRAQVELTDERKKVLQLSSEVTKSKTEFVNLQTRLNEQKSDFEQLQKKFQIEFENLANKIFENKSQKFTELNQKNLSEILLPMNEKLKQFEKRVEETYVEESKQRFSLENEIKKLYDLNQLMTKEASNLTNALKGDSKTQGSWGEMILESILEKSGLVKGREFLIQETLISEEGKRQKPDVIINLPENKNMVIDSKVSLTDYERYCSVSDEALKVNFLKTHISSIRRHIKELSQRNYQSLYGINSPDFVLMFVPIESAFGLAVLNDSNLFYEAFELNIVIVSPSTLLATLRTISNIWRQESQNKNAMEIARQGGELYDKFVGFVDDLIKVGRNIDATKEIYSEAMKKLHSGSGNLVRRTEKIKTLGANATKSLPQQLLDKADVDQIDLIE